jgi:hypothetical protein
MFVYIFFPLEIQLYRRWLGSHYRLFIFVLPLEIQLYRRDFWDAINICLYMFCRWRSSYIEGMVRIPLLFVYICFAVGDPVI